MRRMLAEHRDAFLKVLGSMAVAAALGASWMLPLHWVGPALSIVLVWLVRIQGKTWMRFAVALSYYAAGSIGLVRGVAVFFGSHAPFWEGAALWLGSATALAMGWTVADRPWKAALVLLFDALVPPMAFFDWMSPLASAGFFFPGSGVWGIGLLLAVVIGLGRRLDRMALALLTMLLGFNLLWFRPGVAPAGWKGIDLNVGPAVPDVQANLARHRRILAETLAKGRGARVLLLPETLETDWAGNAWAIQQAVPKGQIWLMGLSVPRQVGLLTDSIVAFQRGKAPEVLFDSAFPVPVSMWHPWSRGTGYVDSQNVGYRAAWWEPVRKIDGVRAWASICYDQLLPFVWMEALIQQPPVVLLTNNEWWAQGTGIPLVQRNTAWAWGRLLGAPEIEAENR